VSFFLEAKASEAKVVCFILVLLVRTRILVESARWTRGLVQSFPNQVSNRRRPQASGIVGHRPIALGL
jgi:hypothetical protein